MSARRREADRARVESVLGLAEEGGELAFHLLSGAPFAKSYQRIVYGDRGPYVEFTRADITARLVAKFWANIPGLDAGEPPPRNCGFYFVWLHPAGEPDVKVYWQVREVAYADYKRGFYYVDPWSFRVRGPLLDMGQRSLFEER